MDHEGTVPDPAGDLVDRADIEALLVRFYGVALRDEVLDEAFTHLRATGLDGHLPIMGDFWETLLFRAGLYPGDQARSALTVHRGLHARTPLTANHFVRWLTLWQEAVDELYAGPVAERAKVGAARIAWSMNRRLNGAEDTYEAVSLLSGSGPKTKRRPVTSFGVIRT